MGPCENNKDCVQCKVFNTGKKKSKECDQCDIEHTVVASINSDIDNKECQFVDQNDNCTFFFSYSRLNDKIIKVKKGKGRWLRILFLLFLLLIYK